MRRNILRNPWVTATSSYTTRIHRTISSRNPVLVELVIRIPRITRSENAHVIEALMAHTPPGHMPEHDAAFPVPGDRGRAGDVHRTIEVSDRIQSVFTTREGSNESVFLLV